ncbi:hypothetical protein ABID70_001464 [Clavibacter michiganensis]
MTTTPSRTRRRVLPIAAAAVAATILLPAGAFAAGAALSQNGGAQRLAGDQTAQIRSEIKNASAKNVILLIGDGMGDSEITIARDYAYGAAGRLPGLDAPPLTGQYTTYSLERSGERKGEPDYVPDSAATGSGWRDRHEDLRRRDQRRHRREAAGDPHRDREGQRPAHGRRQHRRDPGRHPGGPGRARRQPLLLRARLRLVRR